MSDIYKRRFSELSDQLEALLATQAQRYDGFLERSRVEIDGDAFLEWKVKARNLISRACGDDSEHMREFTQHQDIGMYGSYLGTLKSLKSVFVAAREDYEGGYLRDQRSIVQAEVFESELEQARAFHEMGYAVPAAVIAGIVLETTLRALCDKHGLPHGKLDKMNADLVKGGAYNVLVQKQVTAFAAIRNAAAHGQSTEFTDADVKQMIGEVERFVTTHL